MSTERRAGPAVCKHARLVGWRGGWSTSARLSMLARVRCAIRDDDTGFFTLRPEQLDGGVRAVLGPTVSLAVVPRMSTRSKAIPPGALGRAAGVSGQQRGAGGVPAGGGVGQAGVDHAARVLAPELSARVRVRGGAALGGAAGAGAGISGGALRVRTGRSCRCTTRCRGVGCRRRSSRAERAGVVLLVPPGQPWGWTRCGTICSSPAPPDARTAARAVDLSLARATNATPNSVLPLVPRTTLDELLSAFEEARRFGGDFCLATHYWEIDDRLAGMLDALIEHADRAGVRWVPADELFS